MENMATGAISVMNVSISLSDKGNGNGRRRDLAMSNAETQDRIDGLLRAAQHHGRESRRHSLGASIALDAGDKARAEELLLKGQLEQAVAETYLEQVKALAAGVSNAQ